MKEIITRLITNWKSTMVAIILAICTLMLYRKEITVEQFVLIMGAVGTFYGLLKKDTDI